MAEESPGDLPYVGKIDLHDKKMIQALREEFSDQGALVIEGFLKKSEVKSIVTEIENLRDQAFRNQLTGNAYLEKPSPNFAETHVRNRLETTSLSVLAYDQIPPQSILRRVYESAYLLRLITLMTGHPKIYHYNCPLGAINIAIMNQGDYLRWHFDQSEFVVSIPLQESEEGGYFEFVSNIRDENHENYEQVLKVLEGKNPRKKTLYSTPGSWIFFRGKNTLHRVAEIRGKTPRLTALLGFSFEPGATGSDYLKKIRYGRTH